MGLQMTAVNLRYCQPIETIVVDVALPVLPILSARMDGALQTAG
jgi:hypothetical protein